MLFYFLQIFFSPLLPTKVTLSFSWIEKQGVYHTLKKTALEEMRKSTVILWAAIIRYVFSHTGRKEGVKSIQSEKYSVTCHTEFSFVPTYPGADWQEAFSEAKNLNHVMADKVREIISDSKPGNSSLWLKPRKQGPRKRWAMKLERWSAGKSWGILNTTEEFLAEQEHRFVICLF